MPIHKIGGGVKPIVSKLDAYSIMTTLFKNARLEQSQDIYDSPTTISVNTSIVPETSKNFEDSGMINIIDNNSVSQQMVLVDCSETSGETLEYQNDKPNDPGEQVLSNISPDPVQSTIQNSVEITPKLNENGIFCRCSCQCQEACFCRTTLCKAVSQTSKVFDPGKTQGVTSLGCNRKQKFDCNRDYLFTGTSADPPRIPKTHHDYYLNNHYVQIIDAH